MKIDVNSIPPINQYKIASRNTAAIETETLQKEDKVEISSEAKLFCEAFSEAKKSISERITQPSANLGDIAEKVDNGEYGVDSKSLAQDILLDK